MSLKGVKQVHANKTPCALLKNLLNLFEDCLIGTTGTIKTGGKTIKTANIYRTQSITIVPIKQSSNRLSFFFY